ncbi:MAG: nucleotidyltransferase family protein [Clostridia bacterium]|nr:nucleotidyltransferase family protein [Clostridia bacterium]
MQKLYSDVLYLLACAANEQKADKARIENMDLNALYKMCKGHNVTALVASVLLENIADTEAFARWAQEQMKAVYRDANFAGERQKVLAFLEQNGIWYMPLKGIVLKEYYPKPELREFADNDILFDASFDTQVESYMLSRGYRRKQSDSGHVMEYEKEPCFNFEMHCTLYHTNHPVFYAYYKDVKERLIKDADNVYGYHFSDEDFYIFMISHIYKHYQDSGIGIRSILDIYVYLRKKGAHLDEPYIERELQKMEAADFEKQMRTLSMKIFVLQRIELTEQEESLLEYCFRSGTYGTPDIIAHNSMRKMTGKADFSAQGRRKYWFKRLFDMEQYKRDFPRAYKTVVLIPFLIIYRAFRGLTKAKDIKAENEKLKQLEDKS